MPGDASGSNDDELVSQIDELKARMDRLMKGGSLTSNSALLTDGPKQANTVVPDPGPEPAPERTRVRDLLGPTEQEVLENYPKPEDVVAFPEEDRGERSQSADRRAEERPPTPPPPSKPRQAIIDGSLISVGDGKVQPRPRVSSFDDIGSAVEKELAKDNSVPPVTPKKGPDLASRFGPAEQKTAGEAKPEPPVAPPEIPKPEPNSADEVPPPDEPAVVPVAQKRSRRGAIVAIWSFTGLVGATIATLHFTGVI